MNVYSLLSEILEYAVGSAFPSTRPQRTLSISYADGQERKYKYNT